MITKGSGTFMDNERLKELLDKIVKANPNGCSLYFGYDEKISEDTLKDALDKYVEYYNDKTNTEKSSFKDFLSSYIYIEWELDLKEDEEADSLAEDALDDDELYELNELLEEEDLSLSAALNDIPEFKGIRFDIDDIIGDYKINIMFATPAEQNMDMGSIPALIAGPSRSDMVYTVADNALSYLIYQQGYKVSDILDIWKGNMHSDDPFIKSMISEMANWPEYSMAELTVLVKTYDIDLIGELYINANIELDNDKCIEIPKNAMMGLYNEWQGTGSVLEIEPVKSFIIPVNMVRNIQIEDTRHQYEYTVDDVYGLIGSAWKNGIKHSDISGLDAKALEGAYESKLKEDLPNIKNIYEKDIDIDR